MYRLFLMGIALLIFTNDMSLAQDSNTNISEEHKLKFNEALHLAKEKNYTEAYNTFEAVLPLAEAAGDTVIFAKSSKVLSQLDHQHGKRAFYAESYEEALRLFEKGIEHFDDYAPNHEWKAKALERLGRVDN